MTKCPTCNRSYAENFSYCLDDGTPLRHSTFDQATLVIPPPATTNPPSPTVQQRSTGPIILAVIGVIVAVLLVGTVAAAIWWVNHTQSVANQNSNSAPLTPTTSSSPGSSEFNPVKPLSGIPSPSPSIAVEIPVTETKISPGIYQCEVTRKLDETKQSVAIRLVVTVNNDGTYSSRGYMTIPEANIHDLFGMEEKGNYSQSGDTLILTNRRERQFNVETNSWMRWGAPADGSESREALRDVTPNTFQLFDSDLDTWYTFSRVESRGPLGR
jgi:hypothetical protein